MDEHPAGAVRPSLNGVGIWSHQLRFGDPDRAASAAAELEGLGFTAIWVPDSAGGDVFGALERLLSSTDSITIATGIINIWHHPPTEIAGWWHDRSVADQSRVLLGLGVSHAPMIGERYAHPLDIMREYLDELDRDGVPAPNRCLAAQGPKMLELARDRSAGAHPYLVTPEHTAQARARMGHGPLLAPEQGVILETNPSAARDVARRALKPYLGLPNYVRNWRRLGFGDEDVVGGSDRLIDALFAWGTAAAIRQRIDEHLDAGADHICLQALDEDFFGKGAPIPTTTWRRLQEVLA